MAQDVWDYFLTGSSTPWSNTLGNPSIVLLDNVLWLSHSDVATRIDFSPYDTLQIDFHANFLAGKNVVLMIVLAEMANAPALEWVSGVLKIGGSIWANPTLQTFGNLAGQTITGSSTDVSITINNTARTIRVQADGLDSGDVPILLGANEKSFVLAGNNTFGSSGDVAAVEIGPITYSTPTLPLPTPEEGDNDTAHRYLKELVTWDTRQKDVVEYAIPLTTANMSRELLDIIAFSDVKYTNGATRTGYITKIKYDLKGRRIWLELMLEPTDIATDTMIYETGTAPTIYTETGAATQITEGQN
jgi:hypothetical protein